MFRYVIWSYWWYSILDKAIISWNQDKIFKVNLSSSQFNRWIYIHHQWGEDHRKWLVKTFSKIPWQLPIFLTPLLCSSWGHIRATSESGSRVLGKQLSFSPSYLTVLGSEVADPAEGKLAQQQWQVVRLTFFVLFRRFVSVWMLNDFIFNDLRNL